ncbi:MAG: FG-GAP repeat domain-containing protein [Thermogutta sp.]
MSCYRVVAVCALVVSLSANILATETAWTVISSRNGDLEPPNSGDQQTCLVVADFDKDGLLDFAVGERTTAPSVVWYKREHGKWRRRIIDNSALRPEAGGVAADVDGDGDLDLILGQDGSGNAIWWWENPYPNFDNPWVRRAIKSSGPRKHHDQTFGDFDGDGRPELISWNQGGRQLLMFPLPERPREIGEWQAKTIFSWNSGQEYEGFPNALVDIDADGRPDIVGGGCWFKHLGGSRFERHVIDPSMRFTQCAAGQLIPGGFAEVVFSPGDADGDAKWYEWTANGWRPHVLGPVIHGHTCEVGDINLDGHLDILIGEMGSPGAGDKARIIVWLGDGRGNFQQQIIREGQGIHEGCLADLDGDGDLDLIVKPYHHRAPLIEILINPTKVP